MRLPCVQPLSFELWYFLPPRKFHPLPVKLAGIHAKASRKLCRHEFQISACHAILVMSNTVCIAPPKILGNRMVWTKAEVERHVDIGLYEVLTEDWRVFFRHQCQLWLTKEAMKPEVDGPLLPPPKQQPWDPAKTSEPQSTTQT